MRSKHYLVYLLLLGLFTSCKKMSDSSISDPNVAPSLALTSLDGKSIKTDSLKVGLKTPRKRATYYLTIGGDSKPKEVSFKSINGQGVLTLNGQQEETISLLNGTYMLEWKPSALGTTLIKLEMRDSNKNIREASIEVTALDNLPPVANLTVKKLSALTPLEYLIDASESFDKDAAYGGGIMAYEYTIASKKFKTDKPSMNWILEEHGTYNFTVKVSDAEGSTSERTVKVIL